MMGDLNLLQCCEKQVSNNKKKISARGQQAAVGNKRRAFKEVTVLSHSLEFCVTTTRKLQQHDHNHRAHMIQTPAANTPV